MHREERKKESSVSNSNSKRFSFSSMAPNHSMNRHSDSEIMDLGLSLRVLQPDSSYTSSAHVNWQHLQPEMNPEEEFDGIQSKQRLSYVKVNMDGVLVGRKVCILDHDDYFSLALQLEDMFGKQVISGLNLFQCESPFALFYKDEYEHWRTVGDVPWREFIDRVKRMRIICKRNTHFFCRSRNSE